MPFTKVKSSPTFVTEFKNFIDHLAEYKIEFNHGSFMYTIVWYVENNTPNEIELIHFWFRGK